MQDSKLPPQSSTREINDSSYHSEKLCGKVHLKL